MRPDLGVDLEVSGGDRLDEMQRVAASHVSSNSLRRFFARYRCVLTVPSGMFIDSASASVLHALQIVGRDEQALRLGKLSDRLLQTVAQLQIAERSIDGARIVSAPAAVLLVERLVRRAPGPCRRADVLHDAINPGRQTRLAPKVRQAAVDLQKHVLRHIVDARAVGDHPVDQAVDEVLVLIHELAKRRVIACPAPFDERTFVVFLRHSPAPFSSTLALGQHPGTCFRTPQPRFCFKSP